MVANWEFQSIPIDFEVFKALTAKLTSPSDTYNETLRRILHLPARENRTASSLDRADSWTVDGVTFPGGTEFRARYKGKVHNGIVENGGLVVNGKRFESPSPAAMSITGSSNNGWRFWQCRRPGDQKWMGI